LYELQEAREQATAWRKLVHQGIDPGTARKEALAAQKAVQVTFTDVLQMYIQHHKHGWKDVTARSNEWTKSLQKYAPALMAMPVAAIDTEAVLKIIRPLWNAEQAGLASRIRIRIDNVLAFATSHGLRSGELPSRWDNHLVHVLPPLGTVTSKKHHAAVPYAEIGALIGKLRLQEGSAARCLELVILTGCRSGEIRLGTWDEIDFKESVWVVEAVRTKTNSSHIIPLTKQMLAILETQKSLRNGSGLVFPSTRMNAPLSDTVLRTTMTKLGYGAYAVHGFRSSFRDYAGDMTSHERDVCEAALGHKVGGTEGAYRRGTALTKRRALMQEWNDYCYKVPRRELRLPE
jgi:integrase